MKKVFAATILFFLQVPVLNSCTTFFINRNGQMVFGRNYDWISDAGMVCTNLKGLSKTSLKTENGETISWISQYGSITFNQYGKEFPTGGMNEKGLVVELMWLDETKYPANDNRPAIGVLQWIQYQLDNCASIEEVIATDKKIRISPTGTTPLHYLVADPNGNAAAIEFLKGKMVVHKGNELSFPVLTNNIYEQSVKSYQTSTTYGNNSLERFGKACVMIQQLNNNNPTMPLNDYAFDILEKVSQGSYTKWSIVYDITNKKIQFKTNRFQQIKTISFSAFDFTCSSTAMAWDMNQSASGNIDHLFENFTTTINKRIVETSSKESETQVSISPINIERLWKYASGIKCH